MPIFYHHHPKIIKATFGFPELAILGHFNTTNCTWRLVIIQNLYEFWQFFLSDFWAQNVSIPQSLKISLGTKCFKTTKLCMLGLAGLAKFKK